MAVWDFERTSTTMFRIEAETEEEADRFVDVINDKVGTLMVDTSDWRFHKIDRVLGFNDDVEIVEIYSEVG